MAWQRNKIVQVCKECKSVLCPGDRIWGEPRHTGLTDWGIRRVVDQGGVFCEECGRILEYEKEA